VNETVVLITGAASGIGRALAAKLGARGARLVLADLDEAGLHAIASAIAVGGGHAEVHRLDVTDAAAFEALIAATAARHGRLDAIYNNAGIAMVAEARDMSAADFERVVRVNLLGVVYGSLAAYRVMLAQGGGHIVNVASLAGLLGSPTFSAYAASKAGVVAFTRDLATEAQAFGIRVTAVCPGFIESSIYEHSELRGLPREQVRKLVPLPLVPTDRAADIILEGVAAGRALLVFPFYARLLWWLARHVPWLLRPLRARAVAEFRKVRQAP